MNQRIDEPTILEAATAAARAREERFAYLWRMTATERVAAYWRGELSLGACCAWARRFPEEPPTGPGGEYLFILAKTPEFLGEV